MTDCSKLFHVRIEQALNFIMEDHDTLDHHVEHQLAAVMDHIKNLIGKLEKREDNAESRIENIEKLIKQVRFMLNSVHHSLIVLLL